MKNTIIVDIDGTISKLGDRLKYLLREPKNWDSFYAECFEDKPVPEIIDLVQALYEKGYNIIFCTGRRESCRKDTARWLENYFTFELAMASPVLMRPDGDHRHDTDIKPELLEKAGIDLDTIAFVMEDRNSMVKKWRDMGLICLQVAEGDF